MDLALMRPGGVAHDAKLRRERFSLLGARLALDLAAAMPLPIHDRAVVEDGVDGVRRLRLEGMARAFRHVHFNPEPRRGRNLPEALDHLDRSVHDVKIPGDGADHFFLDHMV